MNKIVALIYLVTLNIFSQELIIDTPTLQSGFYTNYTEMKTNNPSIKKVYPVKAGRESTSGLLGVGLGTKVDFYRFKTTRKQAKELGAIFGYSDGKDIFIRPGLEGDDALERRFRLSRMRNASFRKLEIIGKYGYYQDIFEFSTGFRVNANDPTRRERYFLFIDFQMDKFILMNYKSVKDLLKKDKELWENFKNDSKKRKNINKFIKDYILRNKEI